ncbi:hypothetical protein [Methylosinus sporium]|uniref:hypothetical protein n=1 Tax=Methylosinus sporium TaxID=428 RepID=UPI001FEF1C92|nr:hypothetical protein [Methylosinus sporium]
MSRREIESDARAREVLEADERAGDENEPDDGGDKRIEVRERQAVDPKKRM